MQGSEARDEGPRSYVDIPHNVQRQTIESNDDQEEYQVGGQLQKI